MSRSVVAATEPYMSSKPAKVKMYTRRHLRAYNEARRKKLERKYGAPANRGPDRIAMPVRRP